MQFMKRYRSVAIAQLFLALMLACGIWIALPARYWLVDVPGTALAIVYAASALGLLTKRSWALRLARAVSWVALVLGAVVVSALAMVASQLWGLYGPVGAGGAVLMATVAALLLPYLVGLPVLQLVWLTDE